MIEIKEFVQTVPSNKFTHIIGISRGGLIPAVYLSHSLEVPMSVISYSSNLGNGDYSQSVCDIQHSKDSLITTQDHILIVDDICDTGHTLKDTLKYVKGLFPHVETACIHYRDNDVFKPDYFARHLSKTDPWVTYPWET